MAKAKKTKKVAKKAVKKAAPPKKAAKPAKKMAKPAKKTKAKISARPAQKAKKAPVFAQKKSNVKKASVSHLLSPLDDRILIRVEEGEKMTAGGLYIPDTASLTGHFRGEVVAIGRGHLDKKGRIRPIELKIGDRILFAQHSGAKVTLLNEELVILREQEVVGILET